MPDKKDTSPGTGIHRRRFLATSAAAGAGFAAAPAIVRAAAAHSELNAALIGAGAQGRVLLKDSLKIAGIRFKAVCDIWEYSKRYASGILRKYEQTVSVYDDYREMLAKEEDLDVVLIATPDWLHEEQTIACLKAGADVYCEKEMSIALDKAKAMVVTARQAGKMLQIGHQRRSNPVYRLALESIEAGEMCGRITNCFGQWNRSPQEKLAWPARYEIPAETLKKHGYDNMDRFRNWRWYRDLSAGPIADLGSHQIDVFEWFLHARPASVMAAGGSDYYKDREWYEDMMTVYDYKTGAGSVRAFYQVLNTSGFGGYYERFHGDAGTLTISENPLACYYVPEHGREVPAWMDSVERVSRDGGHAVPLIKAFPGRDPRAARTMAEWEKKTIHRHHLENFFGAVRTRDPDRLACPGAKGYATAVAVLNAVPALEAGRKIPLKPADYEA